MLRVKDDTLVAGVSAYMLLVLAPALLKLAGLAYFVQMSWPKATVLVWGPWLIGFGFWLAVGVVSAGQWLGEKRAHKIKIHNDLTVPRS